MNLLDWIFAGIFVLSALWGYKAGLVNLLVNTVAIYVGLFFSGLFAGRILSLIWDGVESKAISTAIGYVIIFIGVFLASRIAVSIINKTTKSFSSQMGWGNKLGGILIGLFAGILIAGGLMTAGARYTYSLPQSTANQSTDSIQLMIENVARNYVEGSVREKLDNWLIESQIVPSLLNLRGFVIEFAPDDFGVSLDILENRIDKAGIS
ncbi:MAG: CvpA family protein [Dehalococcoidia bacterium]|jgi:uncharacterized membrane protein required for colicin V production|nr:CvpA family protein [Dehalococcoidia bacterium]|tara:strand:- start:50 stop:673 length:624 start_codon:yes stop_codon:yes gene_type:complete